MTFTWDKTKKSIEQLKMTITTALLFITTITGGYTVVSKYFVTKVYANELVANINQRVNELEEQTRTNKEILLEMRMIRLENKMYQSKKLTPTEQRVYDSLKKEYLEVHKK